MRTRDIPQHSTIHTERLAVELGIPDKQLLEALLKLDYSVGPGQVFMDLVQFKVDHQNCGEAL